MTVTHFDTFSLSTEMSSVAVPKRKTEMTLAGFLQPLHPAHTNPLACDDPSATETGCLSWENKQMSKSCDFHASGCGTQLWPSVNPNKIHTDVEKTRTTKGEAGKKIARGTDRDRDTENGRHDKSTENQNFPSENTVRKRMLSNNANKQNTSRPKFLFLKERHQNPQRSHAPAWFCNQDHQSL